MILVIIIAAAWIVILTPSLMKRRSQAVGEIGSISHFHRQLRVLEHSGPQPIVAPAYRLRSVDGSGDGEANGSGYPGGGGRPGPVSGGRSDSCPGPPSPSWARTPTTARPARAIPGRSAPSRSRAIRASGRP